MALDSTVNVNSLFTLAFFLGLTWYPTSLTPLSSSPSYAAISTIVEGMIAFHVYSFSSFLFSSLVTFALRQAIKIGRDSYGGGVVAFSVAVQLGHIDGMGLRVGMLFSKAVSVFKCGFLKMALVDFVHIKIGSLA